MSFDIAIYNGFSVDGNKVVNSVKAAYLYADNVKVYDHMIPRDYDTNGIKRISEGERKAYEQYPFLRDPDLSFQELTDIVNQLPSSDPLTLFTACAYRLMFCDRDIYTKYYDLCEKTATARSLSNKRYTNDDYLYELSRIGVEYIIPAIESKKSSYSTIELAIRLDERFFADKGFKIINDLGDILDNKKDLLPMWVPSYLSEYTISSLPGFEEASIDEIIDIRKELDKYIIPYRAAMQRIGLQIKDIPDTESLQRECMMIYCREIEPQVASINAAIKDNNVFKNIGKSFITDDNLWLGIGALVAAFSTTGQIMNAISLGTAVALGGASVAKGVSITKEEDKKIKKNEMFFLYKAGKKLK